MSHIKAYHEENRSWCGKQLEEEFYFKTIDQSVLSSVASQSTHRLCTKCVDIIINLLERGEERNA